MSKTFNSTFGKNLRYERKKRNLTISDIADKTYISEVYIGCLERGSKKPSLEVLFMFCDLFGLTPNDLLL